MDLRRFEVQPAVSGIEKAVKISRNFLRDVGGYAVGFAQSGLDVANKLTRRPTYAELERANRINEINGCYQRGHFFKKLGEMVEEKEPKQLTLSWIDIVDFANSINNTFGHDAGDKALAVSGWAIRTYFRNPRDKDQEPLVGSWGGDEFMCVAAGQDALNQDHPLFANSLDYYHHDDLNQDRVMLDLKQLRNNMEITGAQYASGIYSTLRELTDLGVGAIEFRYSTAIVDIDGVSQGRAAVDQFVREYSKKGDGRATER